MKNLGSRISTVLFFRVKYNFKDSLSAYKMVNFRKDYQNYNSLGELETLPDSSTELKVLA